MFFLGGVCAFGGCFTLLPVGHVFHGGPWWACVTHDCLFLNQGREGVIWPKLEPFQNFFTCGEHWGPPRR